MALFPLFCLSLTLLVVNSALSARIAGFVAIGGSGYMNMRQILEELASRGHEVTFLVPSNRKIKPSDKVAHKVYQVRYEPGFHEDTLIPLDLQGRKLEFFWKVNEAQTNLCDDALNSQDVLKELKGFDLFIYDCISFCGALVGEFLGIPRVEIIPGQPNSPFGIPHMTTMPISYVPQMLLGLSDKMTFAERVVNFGGYLGMRLAWNLVIERNMNALKVKYNIRPERSFQETVGDAEMLIITAEFALEYPQPLLPDQVMVGALNVKDAKPLPPDLEEFVSGSGEHGFIIVSFGSNVASILPRVEVDLLAEAFGNLKQRVLWRLKGYIPSFLASNIKVMDWLPQNDLLGHKDIKAFVSHMGHNSVYESAYHGAPVVAFPLFADQHANAKKVVNFGLGLSVDHQTMSVQQLQTTIELVVNEPRFKQRAGQISGLLKDRRRSPLQETCDWIEYVLRHGGARHLRAQVFNIPWYQYYLLDVMAFLVAVVTLVVMVIVMTCRCLCRLCCKGGGSKTKKE